MQYFFCILSFSLKITDVRGGLSDRLAKAETLIRMSVDSLADVSVGHHDNYLFSLYENIFLGTSILKILYLILKTESLMHTASRPRVNEPPETLDALGHGLGMVAPRRPMADISISYVTPKISYFSDLENYFLDQSIQTLLYLTL